MRFTSRSHAIGCINWHGELLFVVKLFDRPLKTECLGRILPTSEKKPSIDLSICS